LSAEKANAQAQTVLKNLYPDDLGVLTPAMKDRRFKGWFMGAHYTIDIYTYSTDPNICQNDASVECRKLIAKQVEDAVDCIYRLSRKQVGKTHPIKTGPTSLDVINGLYLTTPDQAFLKLLEATIPGTMWWDTCPITDPNSVDFPKLRTLSSKEALNALLAAHNLSSPDFDFHEVVDKRMNGPAK
jgi:hypothetical protein